MTSPSDPPTERETPVVTQRRAWLSLVITGLIIGTAFIAGYVGLQRDPAPSRLPIAVVGEQLAATATGGFGDAVAVTPVTSVDSGAALVHDGDAVAVLSAAAPDSLRLDYAGASGFSESGAARQLVAGLLALSLILLSAASAFTTKALGAWLGPIGIALAVLTLTTIGNATSGATIGVDLLPSRAQAISAKLPPGAAVRAVNNFGHFGGSHTLVPLTVLATWFLTGLGFVLLRQRTAQRRPLTAEAGRLLPLPAGP
ncbi:hypothetical protein [Micromonospora sp. NPDC049102]|uniref:hypothetical protein n=1 Tax=Micromonospora sp. NPDC049102 TaxID=3364265 RepID=UPI00371BDDD8